METIIIALNVILAVILIILVLLQRSEGGALRSRAYPKTILLQQEQLEIS